MRKEERFILRRMVFSIWETLRKIRRSSFSLSMVASRVEAEPWKQNYSFQSLLLFNGQPLHVFMQHRHKNSEHPQAATEPK